MTKRRNWIAYGLLVLTWGSSAASAGAALLRPFPVQQSNPAMMRYLDPAPDSASVLKQHRQAWELIQSYSSIFLADQLPKPKKYLADMELYVLTPRWGLGLGHATQLAVSLPVLRPMAGFLDPFLHRYHQSLNLPNSGRELQPANRYAYFLAAGTGWRDSARWELGNLRLHLRHGLTGPNNRPRIAVEGLLQLPTGSPSRGWSHAGADSALGMLASWDARPVSIHGGFWWVHPFAHLDRGLTTRDFWRGFVSLGRNIEWHGHPLGLVAQAQGGGSPYHAGIAALDAAPWLVSFGVRGRLAGGNTWGLAFVENISQASTQDFGLMLELSF